MLRSCLIALFAVVIVFSSQGPALSQKGYVGEMPAFIGTGPYAVPVGSFGPGWQWVARVNPQYPVFLYGPNGAMVGMFGVRDGIQVKALQANLAKWCEKEKMVIVKVDHTGGTYRIYADNKPEEKPIASPYSPKHEKTVTLASAEQSAVDAAAKEPPITTPDSEADLADLDARMAMVRKHVADHPEVTSLVQVLSEMEQGRDELVERIKLRKSLNGTNRTASE